MGLCWLQLASRLLLFLAALPLYAQSAAAGANQPQDDRFKINVNVTKVLVPVIIRDAQGRVVGDLKKEDFQVFDEGKPQPISGFMIERRAGAPNDHAGGAESVSQPPNAANPAPQSILPQRFIVFLFDDLHMTFEDFAHTQKAAVKVLAETLSSSDMAAVVSISGTNSGLTRDHQTLQDAIMKLKPRGLYKTDGQDCPHITYYQADLMENRHDPNAMVEAVQQVFSCDPGLNRERDQETAERIAESTATRVLTISRQDVQITLSTIREIVSRMGGLPGQSMLVLVSPGFLTIEPELLNTESQIIDLAVRSNVIISALNTHGLFTTSLTASDHPAGSVQYQGEMRRSSMSSEENPMAELADGTGGAFFHNNNDLDAGFKRLAEAPEVMYLLEFSLDNVKPDGRYHHLKVKVDREHLQLQVRQGYFAPKPEKNKK